MRKVKLVGGLVVVGVIAAIAVAWGRERSHDHHEDHQAKGEGEHADHDEHGHDGEEKSAKPAEAGHAEEKSGHDEGKGHGEHGESGGHDEHGEHGKHEEGEEGHVALTAAQMTAAGIAVDTARPGTIHQELAFPAELKLNADNVAHIFPRFAGIVRQVRKSVGDKVKKGDVLAVIESNESLNNYEIKSLIDGTIIERHVTLGEMIREDAECFVVADLASVWVDINVYPKDMHLVREGLPVRLSASHGSTTADGRITYVGPVVSEHTRTALARVVLPNPEGSWRPGTFVTAHVAATAIEAPLVVAREALQTIEGQTALFVETEPGAFRAQPVQLGRRSDREVEILGGLNAGDRYAAKGSFILKAELGKSEAGHSHD